MSDNFYPLQVERVIQETDDAKRLTLVQIHRNRIQNVVNAVIKSGLPGPIAQ